MKRLHELRNNSLNPDGAFNALLKNGTLTNLYNAKPTWLQNAHAALDRAVWNAYGWPTGRLASSQRKSEKTLSSRGCWS